ncbi:MAG TPA: hypothetical protein VIX38_04890 [Nitrososphaeraceae archaeon]
MTRGQLHSVAFLSVLMNLILFSNIHISISQHSYADPQEEAIRTLEIDVNLNNPVVGHGKEQIIDFQVTDQKSDKPVSGAITSATVSYADGKTIKHLSVPTDTSGRSSISWTIERDAPNGIYEVVYSVYQTGYKTESFAGSFNLVGQNADYTCSSSSYPFEIPVIGRPFVNDQDTSETSTTQDVKQKNSRSGESTNFNCGENLIKAGVEDE